MHDVAAEERQLAFQILNCRGGHCVEVLIPNGDIGVLARLDGAHSVFEKDLVRGPYRVGAKGGMHIDGLGRAEWLLAKGALQSLAYDRRPETVPGRVRRYGVVGSATPFNALGDVGRERLQS